MESASSRRFGFTSPLRLSSSSSKIPSTSYSNRRSPTRSPSRSPKFSPTSPKLNESSLIKRYSLPSLSRIIKPSSKSPPDELVHSYTDSAKNENITVTVRFRPLSIREIQKGDQVGWYAQGANVIRMESNGDVAYAFDKVFGPATTTRGVYDVAVQTVVCAAMEGVNGTVFAYGVTSSGKTHTMHGDNKSPGVIPLAVKEVFSIIQETPGREFLLRVSYLEIYNEVINDLLNPAAQNLKIREDSQVGTYVEGLKQEVVLSPAHALSLIAAGEEHRHVGATNYNAISSRSHTIFTLTVESTGRDKNGYEEVALSQLHLIDLAGSESSKTNTTGLRRKEGSFINKSLLTLGTVISKLSDGKPGHVPFRDSKLTRLLQPSLSGNGKISLICTVTPASGTMEETHNTIKFAHRAKYVEVRAEHNRILDEKSLIKKYQKEISELRNELSRIKRERPVSTPEDLMQLREKLEADQMFMQSRLEEEEQSKAALLGRIQRLTKLILVSTKTTVATDTVSEKLTHRRRLSFGEEDLAYLKHRRIDWGMDEEDDNSNSITSEDSSYTGDDREEKKNKRRGMLGWLKLKASGKNATDLTQNSEENNNGIIEKSPTRSFWSSPSRSIDSFDPRLRSKSKSKSRKPTPPGSPLHPPFNYSNLNSNQIQSMVESVPLKNQAGELFSVTGLHFPAIPTDENVTDLIDLLKEQIKILSAELGLQKSNLKRISEQQSTPELEEEIKLLKEGIEEKKNRIAFLESKVKDIATLQYEENKNEENKNEENQSQSQNEDVNKTMGTLKALLSEKTFEMEITNADNRILQDTLQAKTKQNDKLLEEINLLRVELTRAITGNHNHPVPLNKHSDENFMLSPSHSSLSLSSFSSNNEKNDVLFSNDDKNTNQTRENGFITPVKKAGGEDKDEENSLIQIAEMEDLKMQMRMLLEERDLMSQQQKKLASEIAEAKTAAIMQPMGDGHVYASSSYLTLPSSFPESNQLLKRVQEMEEREKIWKRELQEKESLEKELKKANDVIQFLQKGTEEKEIRFESERERLEGLIESLRKDSILTKEETEEGEGGRKEKEEEKEKEIASLSESLFSLKEKVIALENTLKEKDQNLSLLQKDLNNVMEEKERLESFSVIAIEEKDELLSEASEREASLKETILETKKELEKEKMSSMMNDREMDMEELMKEIAFLRDEKKREEERKEEEEEKIKSMEKGILDLKKSMDASNFKCKTMEKEMDNSNNTTQELRLQLDMVNAHREDAEETVCELKKMLDEERKELEKLKREREEESAKSILDEQVIMELKKRHGEDMKRMNSDLLQWQSDCEMLKKTKVEEGEGREELEKLMQRKKFEYHEQIQTLEEEMERRIELKEKEVLELSKQVVESKKEVGEVIKSMEDQCSTLKQNMESLKKEIQSKDALLQSLERQNADLAVQLAEARAKIVTDGLDHVRDDLVRQIKAQESAINALSGREEQLREELAYKDGELASAKEELNNSKQREGGLENDLATMWVIVAELRRQSLSLNETSPPPPPADPSSSSLHRNAKRGEKEEEEGQDRRSSVESMDSESTFLLNAVRTQLARERKRCLRLEEEVAKLKGDDLDGLDLSVLEDLISTHEDALAKIALLKDKHGIGKNQGETALQSGGRAEAAGGYGGGKDGEGGDKSTSREVQRRGVHNLQRML